MPNWNDVLNEVKARKPAHDNIRREYLKRLHERTKRNVIAYYSGWLQKPDLQPILLGVNDEDKNGFMSTIHRLDRSLGLDLILHTPGGDTAATESLVDYLRSIFGTNIRAIVPQLAMSAGTMIACACESIVMGKQSSLGPIDPQFGGRIPAHGVIEEFNRARQEVQKDPRVTPLWQVIVSKYNPAMIGECEKALRWSEEMAQEWLRTGMFKGDTEASVKALAVIKELGDHSITKSHARHIGIERCRAIGLKIVAMEEDDDLQDAILSVHHAFMVTLGETAACKIIENHKGTAFIKTVQLIAQPVPVGSPAHRPPVESE
jgi:hypothetical protein